MAGSGRLHPAELLGEAVRGITSGASRALSGALLFLLLIGALAATPTLGSVAQSRQAAEFRASGGAVQILGADGQIDGAQCEALAAAPGISAAGALRRVDGVRMAVLPGRLLDGFEVTPGLATLLGAHAPRADRQGTWLPEPLAHTLGGRGTHALADGRTLTVDRTFPLPEDGRDAALIAAVLQPVPATGAFDACWVEAWPDPDALVAVRATVFLESPTGVATETTQTALNASLGARFQPARDVVSGGVATLVAVAVGAAIAVALVRLRRLELASARHMGVDGVSLRLLLLGESLAWLLPGALGVLAVLAILASAANPDPPAAALLAGARVLLGGITGVLAGLLLGAGSVREKHLLRYVKDR